MGTREMFHEIRGEKYSTRRALADAICMYMNDHMSDFPPGYSYDDAIRWACRNSWITPMANGSYQVSAVINYRIGA